MGVIMLSLKAVLFCSVAVVTLFPQEANAWGSHRIRIPWIPIIRLPPIRLPRTDPICLNVNLKQLLPIEKITCDDSSSTILMSSTTTSGTPVDPCSVITSRSEWGAPSIGDGDQLHLPLDMIAIYLRGHNCSTKQECTAEAKQLYTEKENYNFMIGGDGTVFEGRGWYKFSDHYFSYGRVEYGVAFIGESISQKMYLSFLYWITCGTSGEMLPNNITDENLISRF
ncbi:hypothetical protein LSH36_979g01000 [Paralvinella palmiformis]|uniref:Peptidoglycan recognition protein family domain-containing protein n=1 Tax=Paralvinella palmiformis TaxID=53620 RepID=A0AAD9IXQ7_9ANNE|nr:hypothetical protein LSH36_979g01000 [Paralvinella palmiformis]